MTPDDPYKGMPLYLRQAAERNLRAVDRVVANVNTAGLATAKPIPNPVPTAPITQTPVATPIPLSPPINFTLGGSLDQSIGAPLPPVTTATARITPPVTAPVSVNGTNGNGNSPFGPDHSFTPARPPEGAYNQSTKYVPPPQEDSEEKRARKAELRKHYGYAQ